MASAGEDVYCTLLISDEYLPGAMVLAHSLRDSGTKKQLVVLITVDTLRSSTISELKKLYDQIIPVTRIINKTPANLYLMDRADLASTFTKIALWKQTQYRRIVYVDADVVALRAPDELFNLETNFAAVPDTGWPDCFNSGVLVLDPNLGDYYALLALAQRGISFDGADQGLLNMHFRKWERMSFTYNCTPSGHYQYVPAYRHFQSSINMVHYIGHDKPWFMGREVKSQNSVYEELLGRWWAVYERHYRLPVATATPGRTVHQYVKGETLVSDYGFSSSEPSVGDIQNPKGLVSSGNSPLIGKTEPVDSVQRGEVTPTPTIKQRRFSAPKMDWDPIRQPPPSNSRPEASNYPTHQYTMSADRSLFQAPTSYPEAPRDMYYQVPESKPGVQRPKPIFPWEERQPKPTRVFADDKALSPEPSVVSPSVTTDDKSQADTIAPTTPTTKPTTTAPLLAYQRTNAWDDMPEIESYIYNMSHKRQGRIQVLSQSSSTSDNETAISPSLEPDSFTGTQQRRRPSMRLTDFPTEIERPSLPVTPAPVRRPSNFWGDERDVDGNLPAAEGVPQQKDWDPLAKLEELQRRQSIVLKGEAQCQPDPVKPIPDRKLPEGAATRLREEDDTASPLQPQLLLSPTRFDTLDFSARRKNSSREAESIIGLTNL